MPPDSCAPLIRQIHFAIEREVNNSMRASDLTHAQVCLIFSLIERENGCCSLKTLEKHLRVAQSTTAGIVKRAEEKGLVACFADPADRRSKAVRITQKGIDRYRETRNNISQTEERILKNLTPEERALFPSLLQKVHSAFYSPES